MTREHRRILTLIEWDEGRGRPACLELTALARRLAQECGAIPCALLLGSGLAEASEEIARYAEEVYVIENALLGDFQADLYAAALTVVGRSLAPGAILMPHTYNAMEIAPKVACRLGSELVTGCISVEKGEQGKLLCSKQVYGGHAVAVFQTKGGVPAIITLEPRNSGCARPIESPGRVIPFACELDGSLALTQSISMIPEGSAGLDLADVVVAGGRGAGTPEGITLLEELAQTLRRRFARVEIGASRALVDAGLFPRACQIGQTGETVRPEVYVAVAISGSTQHVGGMAGSKTVVAINKNSDAPIFEVSDYGAVGTLESILPAFIRQLEDLA